MTTKKSKKVATPKPAKTAKKAEKVQQVKPVRVAKLISFSVSAIIPTQQYGNIQPRIEVEATSIEYARSVVMPIIEDLYQTYAETPLNGRPVKFAGKVTEDTKVVTAMPNSAGTDAPINVPQTAPVAPQGQYVPAPVTTAASTPETPAKPVSEAVAKAQKAISLAMSADAALAIQDQIEKSVKIAPEDKPALINLVLAKRGEFKGK